MKKKLFIMCMSLVWTVALMAQRIAVVDTDGGTKTFRTFKEAIEGASSGSTIYLPGGGFSIADSVKITKKLTIIGIGHKSNNDNVDGATIISGNLFFNQGSSGSAVMACYITGNVNIGEGGAAVNDVLIKCCNLKSVQVLNSNCQEIVINQNYIRNPSYFGGTNAQVTNNVLHSISGVVNGLVSYNIVLGAYTYEHGGVWGGGDYSYVANIGAETSIIYYNVLNPNVPYYYSKGYGGHTYVLGTENQCFSNLTVNNKDMSNGDCAIVLGNEGLNDVFENYNNGSISPNSDFHFKDEFSQYQSQIGIYAGNGFNDHQTAPVPYIVSKSIPDQTDASGKLNIKIRVKAGE